MAPQPTYYGPTYYGRFNNSESALASGGLRNLRVWDFDAVNRKVLYIYVCVYMRAWYMRPCVCTIHIDAVNRKVRP